MRQMGRDWRSTAVKVAGVVVLLFSLSGYYVAAGETWEGVGISERTPTDAVAGEMRKKVVDVEKRLKVAESSLKVVELRLGQSVQPPTVFSNFERRVQEIERRLDAIERVVKKQETLERDMKRMDDRLRKVENRK